MLKKEDIQFQVCRDPNVKCYIVERSPRKIRDTLYKYMTYKNTYRHIDVLKKFVKGYNDTIHSTTGMAPSKVTESDVLKIWCKMRVKHNSIRRVPAKYRVGQYVRISKVKLKFAKCGEQTFTTEIFKIHKICA
jgi:hypothetical protein